MKRIITASGRDQFELEKEAFNLADELAAKAAELEYASDVPQLVDQVESIKKIVYKLEDATHLWYLLYESKEN